MLFYQDQPLRFLNVEHAADAFGLSETRMSEICDALDVAALDIVQRTEDVAEQLDILNLADLNLRTPRELVAAASCACAIELDLLAAKQQGFNQALNEFLAENNMGGK